MAQTNTLFDDARVSSIYITIAPDSLRQLYDSVLSDHYYKVRFIFDDGTKKDTLENTGFRLRGNTSRFAAQKSFKISFNEYVSGRKYQGVKKLNLNGEHNDPTMIREKLFYDLWKKSGMVERRSAFVRIYINNSYYGLYTNLEEMDKEWLARVYKNKDGNLYKCSYPADLVYAGPDQQTYKDMVNTTTTGGRVYDLQTNSSADDYTRLVSLVTVLNEPVGSQFTGNLNKIMNTGHFLKELAIDVATGNWDDYAYNKNNYYMYDNPSDSLFDMIAYDTDNTFGVDWVNVDWANRDCRNWINRSFQIPLAQKTMAIPELFNQYKLYLDTIISTITLPDSVFPRIDAMKQLITAAAIADPFRPLDFGYTVADFDRSYTMAIDGHTPYGLKPFFTKRRETILAQLHGYGIGEASTMREIRVYPNPAADMLNVAIPPDLTTADRISIVNQPGETLLVIPVLKRNQLAINVSDLAPGIYFLLVHTTDGVRHAKSFVKI